MARRLGGASVVRVFGAFIALLGQVVLSRVLGPSDFGQFVYIFSWVMTLSLLSRLGLDGWIVRIVPELITQERHQEVWSIFKKVATTLFLSGMLVGTITLLILFILKQENILLWGISLVLLLPLVSLALFGENFQIALKNVVRASQPTLIFRHLILGVLIVLLGHLVPSPFFSTVVGAQSLNIAAFIVVVIIYFYWARNSFKDVRPEVAKTPKALPLLLKKSLPFLVFSGSAFLNQTLGVLVVGIFESDAEVAYFSVASKLLLLISVPSVAATQAIKPFIADNHSSGKKELLHKEVFKNVLFVGFLGAFGLVLLLFLGRYALSIFGEDYVTAYWTLVILALGRYLSFLLGPVGPLLVLCDLEKLGSKIELVSLGANIILSIGLVWLFGITGAAISLSGFWIFRNLIMLRYVTAKLQFNPTLFNVSMMKSFLSPQKRKSDI